MAMANAHHTSKRFAISQRRAVGGNSGHSGLLWGIEEHVKKIEAIHGNSGGVDADAVVHIFPSRSPTYSYARKKYGTKRGGTLTGKNYLVLELVEASVAAARQCAKALC
ncbi:hypothetical protein THAOC_17812 [Thalassiosira oceanica]|uniref:Uncharacterized protein n=1 Tax=Thalassiosira oceanica TaxID=159749 RepID=K0STU7_THAOC|nr:hypothetical protein THAOC_17812 [Thalassiosira oceanica]|eukprot:EJK61657.1 hypothetical protein THAOC_17812 [Thalassiosira oceanica]